MQLLVPVSVRDRVLSSRVMFGPHETNLGRTRAFTNRHVAYYARRAAGGAGIIVTEEASVHESDWPYERAPLASRAGPGWSAIAAAVREQSPSCVVLGALGHCGGQGTSHWSQREMWAPSPVPEVASREVPKVMEVDDIQAVVRGFAEATRVALASGLDGVEINAGQFSLIRQFLSGLTNMREDAYGSDRLKFAYEVLEHVRSAADSSIVALRLCVDELAPWAGIVPDAGAAIAVALAPYVDLITVVRGSIFTTWATQPDQHVDPGFGIDLARTVRAALRGADHEMPVFAQGSIVDWGQAEWVLESGAADGVEMTRAQIADAELVGKLRAGAPERVRPCLLCNQTCRVRDNRSPIVTCVVDPRSGHETEDPSLPLFDAPARSESRGTLSIVGGGIAGMEAARVAAMNGWSTTIYEATDAVGGTIVGAAVGAGRGRLAAIVDWLRQELDRTGVSVKTGMRLTDDGVAALERKGRVIIATGAMHGTLPFTITEGVHAMHAIDALRSLENVPDGPIVVWDPIGGPIAISVAESFAHAGRTVTLVTPDLLVGEKLSLTGDLAPAQNRLHGLGITLVRRAVVRSVTESGVTYEDRFSGATETIPATVFVACGHRLPDEAIDPGERLPHIGDRVAPRTIHEAILEARRAVHAL